MITKVSRWQEPFGTDVRGVIGGQNFKNYLLGLRITEGKYLVLCKFETVYGHTHIEGRPLD
jgi:hypothetical protein